jgi:hypothetical protein
VQRSRTRIDGSSPLLDVARAERWDGAMAYSLRTRWPGIVAQHADHCRAREGEDCTCGPLGYRASLEDPESGEPLLSPVLDTLPEARAWRHEQREAFDAWRASSEERPTVDSVIEELLAAAARGSARDRYGRRFDAESLRAVRWALTGHVHEELGPMGIAEVRTRHVQALVDRLDAGGLSQRRVDGVVHALRTLFSYAQERQLVNWSPADAVALPDDEPAQGPAAAPTPPSPTFSSPIAEPATAAFPTAAFPTGAPPAVGQTGAWQTGTTPVPTPRPEFGAVTEQVIWTSLKAVSLMFILIALILVAESV